MRILDKTLFVVVVLFFATLPAYSLQEMADAVSPVESIPAHPVDVGLTGALTLGATYAVRKLYDPSGEKLKHNPKVLAWTSAAASILGAVASTYLTGGAAGLSIGKVLLTSVLGWFTAQGARKAKKLANVK